MIERETEQEGDNTQTGSMQLLNALKAKQTKKQPQSKGLMYLEAQVNGMSSKAMIHRCHPQLCLRGGGKKTQAPNIQGDRMAKGS